MIRDREILNARSKNAERAQQVTEKIRQCLRVASENFISAGEYLAAAFEMKVWENLGLSNWTAYCETQLGISDKLGYDLIRIAELREKFPDYAPRMIDVGISKLRLMLPTVEQHPDEDTLDGLLDEASTQTYREFAYTVRDARAGGDWREEHPLQMVESHCPACGVVLRLSRAANISLE